MANPWNTIGFRIELGKVTAFSIVLLFLIFKSPTNYFLYTILGLVGVIAIFSFILNSFIQEKENSYTIEQIWYLRLMIMTFIGLGVLSLGTSLYAQYIGFFGGLLKGFFVYEFITSMFVCFVIAAFTYSALLKTGNKLFQKTTL